MTCDTFNTTMDFFHAHHTVDNNSRVLGCFTFSINNLGQVSVLGHFPYTLSENIFSTLGCIEKLPYQQFQNPTLEANCEYFNSIISCFTHSYTEYSEKFLEFKTSTINILLEIGEEVYLNKPILIGGELPLLVDTIHCIKDYFSE